MSLLASLHDLWKQDAELAALVPPEKIFTGPVPDKMAVPYVQVVVNAERPEEYTAGADYLELVELTVAVLAETLQSASDIRGKFDATIHQQSFTPAGATLLEVRRAGGGQQRHSPERWEAFYDYEFLLQKQLT